MRYLFLSLMVAAVNQLAASGQGVPLAVPVWTTSLPAALQQAQATGRPVLAVFSGSDWCKPCMMLKQEVFDQPEFVQFAQDKLVLARFDFPRNKKNKLPADQARLSEQAAAQLNKGGEFPLVLVLAPDGKILARSGYRVGGAAAYTAYLQPYLTSK
jgi:uncharacterized protein YyaL (SSP411 family)